MAQTSGPGKTDSQTDPPRDGGDPPRETLPTVIVLEYGKKKTKKRGSSKNSRRLIDIEYRVSKAMHRVSRAVNDGVETYLDKRDKSERRRRDGAIVDVYENAAGGVAEAASKSSYVLNDIAKAFNTRYRRKQFRRILRGLPVIR